MNCVRAFFIPNESSVKYNKYTSNIGKVNTGKKIMINKNNFIIIFNISIRKIAWTYGSVKMGRSQP